MLILGIETSGIKCSVAFVQDEAVLLEYNMEAANLHAELLGELIVDGLRRIKQTPAAVELIAVAAGPGSFTGLRIGMAYAKGLAYALDKPIIGVSNFEVLAEQGVGTVTPIDVLIDARMNRFYHARFKEMGAAPEIAKITDLNTLEKKLGQSAQIIVPPHTDTSQLRQIVDARTMILEAGFYAGTLCRLAQKKFAAGVRHEINDLEPMYLQRFAGVE